MDERNLLVKLPFFPSPPFGSVPLQLFGWIPKLTMRKKHHPVGRMCVRAGINSLTSSEFLVSPNDGRKTRF